MGRGLRALSLGILLASISACSFWQKIAEHSLRYNETVEQVHNELLLLNILRSSRGLPMHFTALTAIKGNLSTAASNSAEAAIGGGKSNPLIIPSGEVSSNPTYDVAVLDSQKFMRGILSPVSMETVQLYWEHGWPRDLLFHLLVESVTLPDGQTLLNDPEHESYSCFQRFVQEHTRMREGGEKADCDEARYDPRDFDQALLAIEPREAPRP